MRLAEPSFTTEFYLDALKRRRGYMDSWTLSQVSENEEEPLSGKYDLIIVANPEAVIDTSNLFKHLKRPRWLLKAYQCIILKRLRIHSVLGHGLENDEMFHSVSGSKPMPKYDLIILANPEAVINTSNLLKHHLKRPRWLFKACRKSAK
ncbi:hypothetical protein CEP51_003381 [Fusarium floridanum]|uniref:Uncharacterized protein n=1 Tax=Fusarium floridanum TaxID=1325733 RepID=A0A428S6B0_9HYPO|nr:hypothetical protein CEP51_003381 [Fusarium floridanum]